MELRGQVPLQVTMLKRHRITIVEMNQLLKSSFVYCIFCKRPCKLFSSLGVCNFRF